MSSSVLENLHKKTWGVPWPSVWHSVSWVEDSAVSRGVDGDADDLEVDSSDSISVMRKFDYECLLNMHELAQILQPSMELPASLVVFKMYTTFVEVMMSGKLRNRAGFVVTGQPGIGTRPSSHLAFLAHGLVTGKTTFILFLLLHLLSQKIPVAIQMDPETYYLFDETGVSVHDIGDGDERLKRCWLLTDSNDDVTIPCRTFRKAGGVRIVQTTLPKLDRWKGWATQKGNIAVLFMDLPMEKEILAVMCVSMLTRSMKNPADLLYRNEHHFSDDVMSRVPAHVQKWGPSIRTVLQLARADSDEDLSATEDVLRVDARRSAGNLCHAPKLLTPFSGGLASEFSNLVFIRPQHHDSPDPAWRIGVHSVPTEYLQSFVEEARANLSNEQALALFEILSTHSFTRTARGWHLELNMHKRLCTGDTSICIQQSNLLSRDLAPSTALLPGTLNGLKGIADEAFYWIPFLANFPGIDGVLGDHQRNIYALQATVASEHSSPVNGLKKLWGMVPVSVRTDWTWHFVVVTDTRATADEHARIFSNHLQSFKFRRNCDKEVSLWCCVY